MKLVTVLFFLLLAKGNLFAQVYNWEHNSDLHRSITQEIAVPDGYQRIDAAQGSFGEWLRNLPLKSNDSKVFLYNKKLKANQSAHHAVIDIDVGARDLQQCADAIIRLRAEYQYSEHKYDDISFNFTSGDSCTFRDWINGMRPVVSINKVIWKKSAEKDSSYQTFRKYLNRVFTYAGSYSLEKEMLQKSTIAKIDIGDVFIQGGFPGHAVIVVDVAENIKTGDRIFLLAQSYMPAQDVHILLNPDDSSLSPWYSTDFGNVLKTPEWIFTNLDLHAFK